MIQNIILFYLYFIFTL